jgi:hypothetical protein
VHGKIEAVNTVFANPAMDDETRRHYLYNGQIFAYSARPSSLALIEHARELIAEAFGSMDPETAQHKMPVEQFAAVLAELKPKFIHHPSRRSASRRCWRGVRPRPPEDVLRRPTPAYLDLR